MKHTNQSELELIGTVHVDDIKIAYQDDSVFNQMITALAKVFGKGEIEITHDDFACCGVQYTKLPYGYSMDQNQFVKGVKEIEGPLFTGKPDQDLCEPKAAKAFLSVIMSLAYALLTRSDISIYLIAMQKSLQKPQYLHVRKLNGVLRWAQKNPRALTYRHMKCAKKLEAHSYTGFRREENEEGDVDGKAIRGVNIIRLGQQISEVDGIISFVCHLIDWIIGAIKVVVRSTFTAETHGVITGADHTMCIALTFHEIECGPVSLTVARNLTEYSGLTFDIHRVTDARNLLLILRNVNKKNPADKNCIAHLLWLNTR